ncbi:MAG: hypothetical protein AAFQ06_03375 [Pseudomonadota bacterium]
MHPLRVLATALAVALVSPASAQTDRFIETRLALLQTFYDTHPFGTAGLEQSQRLLGAMAGDAPPPAPTGQWDAATVARFAGILETMRAIGFVEIDTNDPDELARFVIGWVLSVIRAEILLTDFPD